MESKGKLPGILFSSAIIHDRKQKNKGPQFAADHKWSKAAKNPGADHKNSSLESQKFISREQSKQLNSRKEET